MAITAPGSSSFRVASETKLAVARDSIFRAGKFTVTDELQGGVLFKLETEGHFIWSAKRRLYDATSGKVVLLMKQKMSWFRKAQWQAFRGDSENESELLFTVGRKQQFFGLPCLEIFLPENNFANPDFTLELDWTGTKFTILSNGRPIAEAKRQKLGMAQLVTVDPRVDLAFISALTICWMLDRSED